MNIDSNILLVANRNINLLNDAHLDDWYFLEYHRLNGVNQVSRHFTASSHCYMFACYQKLTKSISKISYNTMFNINKSLKSYK